MRGSLRVRCNVPDVCGRNTAAGSPGFDIVCTWPGNTTRDKLQVKLTGDGVEAPNKTITGGGIEDPHRRRWLRRGGSFAAALTCPPVLAAGVVTPPQMRGPFYPATLPLDRDNDLVTVTGRPGLAYGTLLDVAGRVTDPDDIPIDGVALEIWQVNGHGRYHHPDDGSDLPWDPHFQGFGSTSTDRNGAYRFRTVRPLPYPGRAPHVHFAVKVPGERTFYTQMYLDGAPENATDFLLNSVQDRRARQSLIVRLEPSPNRGSALLGRFDIVLGVTPVNGRP